MPTTTPTYDPATGEIQGCTPGSVAYRHEQRHAQQEATWNLLTLGAKLEMTALLPLLALPLAGTGFLKLSTFALMAWPAFFYTVYRLILEVDAELHARFGIQLLPLGSGVPKNPGTW